MIQRLLVLLCLPLFLTACTTTVSDEDSADANPDTTDIVPKKIGYDSLTEASEAASNSRNDKTLTLDGIGVQAAITFTEQLDGTTSNTAVIANIADPITSITFDSGFGDMVSTSIYIGDQTHSYDDFSNDTPYAIGGVSSPDNDQNTLYALRAFGGSDDDSYNFISNYMVGNIWTYFPESKSETTAILYTGVMIAGF